MQLYYPFPVGEKDFYYVPLWSYSYATMKNFPEPIAEADRKIIQSPYVRKSRDKKEKQQVQLGWTCFVGFGQDLCSYLLVCRIRLSNLRMFILFNLKGEIFPAGA